MASVPVLFFLGNKIVRGGRMETYGETSPTHSRVCRSALLHCGFASSMSVSVSSSCDVCVAIDDQKVKNAVFECSSPPVSPGNLVCKNCRLQLTNTFDLKHHACSHLCDSSPSAEPFSVRMEDAIHLSWRLGHQAARQTSDNEVGRTFLTLNEAMKQSLLGNGISNVEETTSPQVEHQTIVVPERDKVSSEEESAGDVKNGAWSEKTLSQRKFANAAGNDVWSETARSRHTSIERVANHNKKCEEEQLEPIRVEIEENEQRESAADAAKSSVFQGVSEVERTPTDPMTTRIAKHNKQQSKSSAGVSQHLEKLRPFGCELCRRSFGRKTHLKTHMLVHDEDRPFSCELCEKSFKRRKYLAEHMSVHTEDRPFSCELCEKSFERKKYLLEHMSVHDKDSLFSCELCERRFKHRRNLLGHMSVHDSVRLFSCNLCERRFKRSYNLKSHMSVHNEDRLFSCELCEKSFKQKKYLLEHMSVHVEDRPFSCELCGKSFKRKSHLNTHMFVHDSKKSFYCGMCGESFARKNNISDHLWSHIDVEHPFCYSCQMMFVNEEDYSQHLEDHIEVERPFTCGTCSKRFDRKSKLTRHMRKHMDLAEKLLTVCKVLLSEVILKAHPSTR